MRCNSNLILILFQRPDVSAEASFLYSLNAASAIAMNRRKATERSPSRHTIVSGAIGTGGERLTKATPCREVLLLAAARGTRDNPLPAATKLITVCRCIASCATRGVNPEA